MKLTNGWHALCFCAILAAALFPDVALAGGSEDVRLRIRDTVGFAGGEVAVPVTMDASPKPSSIAFWIEFDESKLSFQGAEPGLVLTLAGKDVSWDFPAPGRVSFLIFGINDTRIASGRILTLKFDVDADVSVGSELTVDGLNESATDPEADSLETEIEGGTIDILQCFQPSAPTNFSATDGLYPGYVQLSWTPVFGAQSYVIYRSDTNNLSNATILASTILPFFADTTARGANTIAGGGGGCNGGTAQSVNYATYYYWVLAQNLCGQSELTAADSGYRGELKSANTTGTKIVTALADPAVVPDLAPLDAQDAGIPDFEESVGSPYEIAPDGAFDTAPTFRIPVPRDVEPSELLPYYYVPGDGWYPGPNVDGWLGSVSVVETESGPAIEFDAHHGGVVQLGYLVQPHVAAGMGTLSNAAPLVVAGLLLGLASRSRRHTRQG